MKKLFEAISRVISRNSEPTTTNDPLLRSSQKHGSNVAALGEKISLGVHYFGSHDPISFWDGMRVEDLPRHFDQIVSDGFDTVNLLIPWHAFFPTSGKGEVSDWYGGRLIQLLAVARSHKLAIHGRLFYSHSPTTTREAIEHHRQYALLSHPETSVPSLECDARALHSLVQNCPAWQGAFITWEDFWPCFEGPPHWSLEQRTKLAGSSGFAAWIETNGLFEEAIRRELPRNNGQWVIPQHRSSAMRLWQGFFDHVLHERVLVPCSKSFTDVGIEVRTDAYPLPAHDKNIEWSYFDTFSNWRGAKFLYWGPFFGAQNQGELLTGTQAKNGLQHMLARFSTAGQAAKPVIDQFNFTDETLLFAKTNARIRDEEVASFIVACADVFQRATAGYALWAYRDYRENWLVNPSFQRGLDRWITSSASTVLTEDSELVLQPADCLQQQFFPEMRAQANQEVYQDFYCEIQTESSTLDVFVDEHPAERILAPHGYLMFKIPHATVNWRNACLAIKNTSGTRSVLQCVYFYGFVQRLRVRDEYGRESNYLNAIRQLNQQLRPVEVHQSNGKFDQE